MTHKIVHKTGWVMAICDTTESANRYLNETLPDYIRRGYLMDKTATIEDFKIEENK